jgi:hypothetical protein
MQKKRQEAILTEPFKETAENNSICDIQIICYDETSANSPESMSSRRVGQSNWACRDTKEEQTGGNFDRAEYRINARK